MANTPKSIKVEIDYNKPEIKQVLEEAEKIGYDRGFLEGRADILNWLERAYIEDAGRPDRGTPKAEAILEIARAAGAYLRKPVKK